VIGGFKVKCCTCGTVLYETTGSYDPKKPLTGDQLRLLPLYKYWPTYDGALSVKSTSRFMMFCSQCGGYVSTTGKLYFADFPDEKVHVISEERSSMSWTEINKQVKGGVIAKPEAATQHHPAQRVKVKPEAEAVSPKDMMKEIMTKKITRKKKRKV